ncbi:site-specific DNA-methyltransferase [Aminithiophilus ramosus]|uniref:Methyltransferase n=1 Tax=Aminithiophilus ramosus TaxID=3029084 RepID=A0A9Q7AA11_9BACT|nr:site-specific DNA-methyltransferase [Aminithiophilus ramosus]QTX33225.1 site-specific DNA-methyltransferase [Aminithiophilus ramosus]
METKRNVLVEGDCLSILPSLPDGIADAVITDPPYSSGGMTSGSRQADPVKKYQQSSQRLQRPTFQGDNRDQRSWGYWCSLWIGQCLRTLKEGGYFLMFSDWRQLPMATDALQAGGCIWRGVIAWDKTEAARPPHKGYFRHQCEYVVWGSRGALSPTDARGPWPGCMRVPVRQKDKFHLTGKPTELMRQLVRVAPPGGLILDPFAGSGTTCLAAYLEGRDFLGIEMDRGYAEVARGRLIEAGRNFGAA